MKSKQPQSIVSYRHFVSEIFEKEFSFLVLLLDYVRTGLSSLTFTSNGTQIIPLRIIDDDEDEPAETFLVGLRNAQSEATVRLSPSSLTITITDNDEPPTPTVYTYHHSLLHHHSFPH